MPISVVNQYPTHGGTSGSEQIITPTPGNWLVALVSWTVTDGSAPQMCVGDWARNLWTLAYSSASTVAFASYPSAQLWTQVWVCPNVRYDGWPNLGVYITPMAMSTFDVGSTASNILEISGMGNGMFTVDSVVTGTATNANGISLTLPAPTGAVDCLQVASAAGNIAYGSYTTTGAGWTQLANSINNGPEIGLFSAWREATTGDTVGFNLVAGFNRNWAATAVSIRQTGVAPAQPNPNWPAVELQLGLGSNLNTPITAVTWTDISTRFLAGSTQRGIQYELGTAQSQPTDLTLRNDDGVLTPRPGGTATASGTGTTTTLSTSNAAGVNVGDFFQLQTSGGALKELSVFIVTAFANGVISFARADGTPGGAQAATAVGDIYAALPLDVFVPYRWLATWGGKRYPVMSGWIERFPQAWKDPHWGESPAVAVDALATLTPADLSPLRGEILRRRPARYWPLSDSAAASTAQDISGNGGLALTQTQSKNGAGANGGAAFGASTQDQATGAPAPNNLASIVGDNGSGWQVSGLAATEYAKDGFALTVQDPALPSVTGGITFTGVIYMAQADYNNVNSSGATPTVVIFRNFGGAGAQGSVIKISLSGFANANVSVWDASTHAATTTAITSVNFASPGQFVFYALSFTQTSWSLYFAGQVRGSGSCNLVPNVGGLDIGGESDRFFTGKFMNALHAHIALFPRVLSTGEVTSLESAVNNGYLTSFAGANDLIARKLNTVGWNGSRVLNYGDASTGTEIIGSTIADKVLQVANYGDGKTFVDAAGQVQYRDRKRAYYQTSRAVLGDRPDMGEIPYSGDLALDFDTTYLYNTVTTENIGIATGASAGEVNASFVATNATAAAKYGSRTLSTQASFNDDHYAFDMSWWRLSKYQAPRLRLSQVVIKASGVATSAAWTFCLAVEVGDVVTVNKRPIGAPAISLTCVVLSVKHDVVPEQAQWDTTLTLGIAPPNVLTCNDPVLGIVGSNVIGA